MPSELEVPGVPAFPLTVPATLAGQRLDRVLALLCTRHSRSRMKAWIEGGQVRVDGKTVLEPKHKLRGGELLAVDELTPEADLAHQPQDLDLTLVYEDADVLVVDKPAGLVVHPGSGNRDGTLLNALLHRAPELANLPRAGIVHRLDKDTSGLMVVARTLTSHTELVRQLAARTMKREYLAIAHGDLARATTIDAPIGRHPTQRTSMAVVTRGKPARTHVEVLERFGNATLLRCRLETGRTHQIRVHLTALGHPLLGDPTYRGRRRQATLPDAAAAFPRQALHAQRLAFVHPRSHEDVAFERPPPNDFLTLLAALRAMSGVSKESPR
jgi:23S rRNA pseudouridine1911/1915/1917 synthase